ncbi:polyprenyl synthetase family protein [Candidatus Pseudothioglobus singularis]|nr:farnesyl diphosphate synthase [Candidatus Pseudothioglobus singularis]MDB0021553.1 polyprenyl synthetase family protein [Candidatus Pseudothioglobus singularis]MDB4822470.1 polyprenyl synthetase family protein [Candidatus Pseudothioglobus singularis]
MIIITKKNLLKIHDQYRERVNSYLNIYLSSIPSSSNSNIELKNIMKYSVLAGGKRFRPILTYTVASLYDSEIEKADSSASAIELIHIYSLIHDDLPAMDDDDIRHNQPSNHKVFGEAQAILAGDGLQALAFSLISNDPLINADTKIKLLELMAKSSYAMAEGQSIDLSVVSKKVDLNILNKMHQKKTGALLNCSIKFGALLHNASENDLSILESFASHLGLAYQIQDDVLDVTASDEVLGKRQNSDAVKNKPSYPSIIGLNESIKTFENLYQNAQEELSHLSVDSGPLSLLTTRLMNRSY